MKFTQYSRARFRDTAPALEQCYDDFSVSIGDAEFSVGFTKCEHGAGRRPTLGYFIKIWNDAMALLKSEPMANLMSALADGGIQTPDQFRQLLLRLGWAEDREFMHPELK